MRVSAFISRDGCSHEDCFGLCGWDREEVSGEVFWSRRDGQWAVEVEQVGLSLAARIAADEALIEAAIHAGEREGA